MVRQQRVYNGKVHRWPSRSRVPNGMRKPRSQKELMRTIIYMIENGMADEQLFRHHFPTKNLNLIRNRKTNGAQNEATPMETDQSLQKKILYVFEHGMANEQLREFFPIRNRNEIYNRMLNVAQNKATPMETDQSNNQEQPELYDNEPFDEEEYENQRPHSPMEPNLHEEEEEDDGDLPELNQLRMLYQGARITTSQCYAILQMLRTKHQMTDSCFKDVLRMLSGTLLPKGNCLPLDVRTFEKEMYANSPLEVKYLSENDFVVFRIRPQLEEIIQRNWRSFIKFKKETLYSNNFDYCGTLCRENGTQFINLSLYTGKVNWQQVFGHLREELKELREHGIRIDVGRGKARRFCVRFVEILADSVARADILGYKSHSGYYSCPICEHPGRYEQRAVRFPASIHGRLRHDFRGQGIQDGRTPLTEFMSLPDAIGADAMHTTHKGTMADLFVRMYTSNVTSRNTHNRKFFDNLQPKVWKPLEFNRHFRSFKEFKYFKANEWRSTTLFYTICLFQELRHVENDREHRQRDANVKMLENVFLLCSALSVLATKNLTKRKIQFAGKMMNKWYRGLGRAFGKSAYKFTAHMHTHYPRMSFLHGAVVNRTCYAGEAMIGYLAKTVRVPKIALGQMVKCLIAWKSAAKMEEEDDWQIEIGQMLRNRKRTTFDTEWHHIVYDLYEHEIFEMLRSQFGNVRYAKALKHEQFIFRARQLVQYSNDSIFYKASTTVPDQLVPAFAEIFVKNAEDKVSVVYRNIHVVTAVAKTLNWIPGIRSMNKDNSIDLLTDDMSFPNYYIVETNELSDLFIMPVSKIVSKGFLIENNNTQFVVPLNTFDHD